MIIINNLDLKLDFDGKVASIVFLPNLAFMFENPQNGEKKKIKEQPKKLHTQPSGKRKGKHGCANPA